MVVAANHGSASRQRQRQGGRWGALIRIVAVSVAAVAVGGFPGAGGVRGIKSSNRTIVTTKDGGELVWKFETGSSVLSSPTLSNDGATVYVGSYDHYLYAVGTGNVPSPPPSPPGPGPTCRMDGCVTGDFTKQDAKRDCCYSGHQTYKCKGTHWRCDSPTALQEGPASKRIGQV